MPPVAAWPASASSSWRVIYCVLMCGRVDRLELNSTLFLPSRTWQWRVGRGQPGHGTHTVYSTAAAPPTTHLREGRGVVGAATTGRGRLATHSARVSGSPIHGWGWRARAGAAGARRRARARTHLVGAAGRSTSGTPPPVSAARSHCSPACARPTPPP